MKLDRNINPNGKGKYALINLRTNKVEWGYDDQFFVIKYKDEFAVPALRAYADAVRKKADHLFNSDKTEEAHELLEFAEEIYAEAADAESYPDKKLPD